MSNVLLVIMGLELVLLDLTVMTLWVTTGNLSPSIGGLLKPIKPNGTCPLTTGHILKVTS